jgi:transcriptional regulator with XRE-family HTH domain
MKEAPDYISENLKNIRQERGLSLDKTAVLTNVSKGMLAQIERGESMPTVTTLWKIANGLKISFSSLMNQRSMPIKVIRRSDMNTITDENEHYRVHTILPFHPEKQFETFYVELDPGHEQTSLPHNPGVEEHLFVKEGVLEIDINGAVERINEGEAIIFEASVPHTYKNSSQDILQLFVLIYYTD